MNAYVGFEGYVTRSGFIHKELCIYYDGDAYDHCLFKKPQWNLSEMDMATVRFATLQLNGLQYNDGGIPYKEIDQILNNIEKHNIYTFCEVAVETLKRYLPNNPKIKNIQDLGYEMPKRLKYSYCFRAHTPRYCAKSKAQEVKNFMNWFY